MIKILLCGLFFVGIGTCLAGICSAQTNNAPQSSANASQDEGQIKDQDIELLRKDFRSKKKQLVAANLKLTDDRATKFWPVYDQYTDELVKINGQKYALIKEFVNDWGNITDVQAEDLTRKALAVDEQVAQLRIRYIPTFLKVLPGRQTATFFQIDRRLQMMIDLQLMSHLPLLQSQ